MEYIAEFFFPRMGKKGDLRNFECGMVVGAISRVYKEWCEKGKTSSMWQSCG